MKSFRYAMIGGGRDALIGAVHRQAIALDGRMQLIAGALSSTPEKARASGRDLGLCDARNHERWQDLLEDELKRGPDDRADCVVIVTPNHTHYPIAHAFALAGFHVVCDKPLSRTLAEAESLAAASSNAGIVFGVTYNYTGYPMVREARDMIRRGVLGEIRKVVVEYHQGWLARNLEASGHKQADWRTDPARSGIAGAVGDIGSHAENLVHTVTGLPIEALCADLATVVPGRRLDDDGNLLVRYVGGARGVMMMSQIEVGHENDLSFRITGTDGSLLWWQEKPETLVHNPIDGPRRLLRRGSPWLSDAAKRATRLPAGHPEGFIEAFANVYAGVIDAIEAVRSNKTPEEGSYPTVLDGARGVRFIERTVESARSSQKWTEF